MANYVSFTSGYADFDTWTTSGDFTLFLDLEHTTTTVPTYFLGEKDFSSFSISNSNGGGLQFRLTPSLVYNVGGVLAQGRHTIQLSRTGDQLTTTIDGGTPNVRTYAGEVRFSRIAGIPTATTTQMDFYRLTLTAADAGNRDYVPSPTGIPDLEGGNAATLNGTYTIEEITAPDTTPPVITRLGDATVTVTEGNAYTDAGFTATDDVDGDITANIVVTNPVDVNTVGTYTVRANVSDAAGNAATEVTRTVIVQAASGGGDAIAISEPVYANFVEQRETNGSATVSYQVNYTGTPTALEYRLLNATTSAVVTDWTTFDNAPTGGTSTLSVSVAGALTPYSFEVRFSNDVGVTAAQAVDWYVGDRILIIGQSLAQRLSTTGTEEIIQGYFRFSGGENVAPTGAAGFGQSILAKDLIGETGVATAILNMAWGGSALAAESGAADYWDNTSGNLWQNTLTQMNSFTNNTNEIAFVWWHQGTTDGVEAVTYEQYLAALQSFFGKVRVAFSATSGTLPLLAATVGRGFGIGSTDADHQAIRKAQIDYYASANDIYPISAYQIQLQDGVHGSQLGYANLMHNVAATYLNIKGVITYPPLSLSGTSVAGSVVTLTYDSDLALDTNYDTEGVAVFDNSVASTVSSVTRTGARTVDITLSSAPTGTVEVIIPYGIGSTNNALIFPRKAAFTLDGGDAYLDALAFDQTASAVIPNQPPIANAGPDQSVAAGVTVTLDGTGSTDSDGTIASYAWTQTTGDTVTLTGASTATPSFTAPSTNAQQTLTFQLTVTDDDGATATDTVNVVVAAQVVGPTTSTLNATLTGIPDGTYLTRVIDTDNDAVLFKANQTWVSGVATFTLSVAAGANVEYYAYETVSSGAGLQVGVTE